MTLLYGLDDRPPQLKAILAASAHLLAIVASIATAPLLIARGLGLDPATTSYVIGSALIVSGLATFVQVIRLGPIGSGLLSIQGTSFSFIGVLMYAGATLSDTGMNAIETIGTLLGSASLGAACTVIAGYYIERLRDLVTVNVTGIAIFLLGLSLVGSALQNFTFTVAQAQTSGLPTLPIFLQAVTVIGVIVLCATRRNPWLRLASISLGLLAGMGIAALTGSISTVPAADDNWILLQLLPFPLGFDLGIFLILLPIFFVTMTEAVGDLTATSMLSRQPLTGPAYWHRIRGGVMADGLNSMLAALVGTFPNTTFSQNNGVIQVTAVASRYIGVLVAAFLVLLGSLPAFTHLFQMLPGGVLHSATGLLFAMIAWAGLRILRTQEDSRRGMTMLVVCTVAALALTQVPKLVTLPDYLALLFSFPVASGAILALVWEAADVIRR